MQICYVTCFCNVYAWILIKYQLHFDFLVVFTPPKALSTSLPCFVVIVLLKSAFLFFVLTSGRTLPGTTFFVLKFEATLQPLCSADRDSGIFCTAATALFIAVKGLSLQRETAIFCYCCSQPFCSSFVALLEVILQRCSSAVRFVRAVALGSSSYLDPINVSPVFS